jgi:hypothetical protein
VVATAVAALGAVGSTAGALVGIATRSGPRASSPTEAARAPRGLALVAALPPAGGAPIPPDSTILLRFSAALDPSSPTPRIDPPLSGTWTRPAPDELAFVPASSLVPGTSFAVVLPSGRTGIEGRDGERLSAPASLSYEVAPGSVLRLEELLAALHYLPLRFEPATPAPAPLELAMPQPGSFAWRFPMPPELAARWQPGVPNVLLTGAVMTFERVHGLATDGIAGPEVWTALLGAAGSDELDPDPYDDVVVSTAIPETLTLYVNGKPVLSSPANTGIPEAPTPLGTWPIYAQYRSSTMRGVEPDGVPYDDRGVPWVSYFHDGDAIHGFVRAHYGYPQSLGCVELPVDVAARVWPLTPVGTLVTVA